MTTARTYRSALPRGLAVAEMRRCAGTQFDPRVVEVLVDIVSEGSRGRFERATA
jgi:HD-GYP domain-containing protein (c-di-GMP phosphodiesterase class II)